MPDEQNARSQAGCGFFCFPCNPFELPAARSRWNLLFAATVISCFLHFSPASACIPSALTVKPAIPGESRHNEKDAAASNPDLRSGRSARRCARHLLAVGAEDVAPYYLQGAHLVRVSRLECED